MLDAMARIAPSQPNEAMARIVGYFNLNMTSKIKPLK
jgi:hypothetical protein